MEKLTNKECQSAISQMKINKSPGSDGFTVKFYRLFWDYVQSVVTNSTNECLHLKKY